MAEEVFKSVSECPSVKGYRRSIIYDLYRKTYDYIPNSLHYLLESCQGKSLTSIKKEFDDPGMIDEYLVFLLEKEYIFMTEREDLASFPGLDRTWEYPALVSNAVISLNAKSEIDFPALIIQLEELGCRHLCIISENPRGVEYYITLLKQLSGSNSLSVEIIAPFEDGFDIQTMKVIISTFARLRFFILISAPEEGEFHMGDPLFGAFVKIKGSPHLNDDCRNNFRKYFNVNINLFSEAQAHNPFFNRKVFIDAQGYICNNSLPGNRFGHLDETPIKEIIEKPGFKRIWNISKDSIEVCRDCEYRYMCLDNRIPDELPEKEWRHRTECHYNPYIGLWKGEQDYLSVKDWERNELLKQ